ncbi:MAG: hypothetical protein SFV15_15275 [Polyangiaceae bacterium]|nr:hypothetical protein [Polyangiaceae bacterium]
MRLFRFVALAVASLGVLLVVQVRAPLAETFHELKTEKDVYPLPPPEQAVALSLGYRAALADMIFAQLLVSYGLHFQERRLLEFTGSYLDTINALDPQFRTPYMLADTLLTIQPVPPPRRNYWKAREVLERGMRSFPFDSELHINAGQYMLYLGMDAVKEPAEKEEWKAAGGRALARACEVLGDQKNLPFHCIHAAALLEKEGKRAAMLAFVRKVLAVVDDPEIREKALRYLEFAEGEEQRAIAAARLDRIGKERAKDAPYLSRDLYALLPPPYSALACLGARSTEPACATSWYERGDALASRP